jgi:hypothetical protein
MTYSNAVSGPDNIDELPRPAASSVRDASGSALPRPVSLVPNVADSGRITFGGGYRLLSK